VIPIPEDLSCPEKKVSKEDVIVELCCHGKAMGILVDAFGEKMEGGDLSLKEKVLRDREKYNKRSILKKKERSLMSISKLMLI
jgi:hypothetical protein